MMLVFVGVLYYVEVVFVVGVDVFVVQGYDVGVYMGLIGMLLFVLQIVDFVGDVLVLVVGGIVMGWQIFVVFVMGVQGVWLGMVWLMMQEYVFDLIF